LRMHQKNIAAPIKTICRENPPTFIYFCRFFLFDIEGTIIPKIINVFLDDFYIIVRAFNPSFYGNI
ncbi:TPA: hypothetical protein ACFORT_001963, partial [Neisseria meningitidis]